MNRRESQNKKVAQHLKKNKTITWMDAEAYGIKRLASRIKDLKYMGIPIDSKMVFYGREVKFARYTLMKSK